jgi:AraC family transcriptional regulator
MSKLFTKCELVSLFRSDGFDTTTFGPDCKNETSMLTTRMGNAEYTAVGSQFHLIEYCLAGHHKAMNAYDHRIGSALCDYRPGGVFYCPNANPGNLRFEGDVMLVMFMVPDRAMARAKADLLRGDPDRTEPPAFNGSYNPKLREVVRALFHSLMKPTGPGCFGRDQIVQSLCAEVLQQVDSDRMQPDAKRERRLTSRELSRALEALAHEVTDRGRLERVASNIGLSPFYFSRAFKATTGQSPHQFLIDMRIGKACQEMLSSSQPLSQIALACGFVSQAHMAHTFRSRLNVTPTDVRQAARH